MTLLIADDELIIRKGLCSLDWKSIGIKEVLSAQNGIEANKIIASKNVDILLTDIRMPGADGIELAQFISDNMFNTAVIFLTGYSEFEYARKAIQLNVYEYILKPINPENVLKTVANVKEKLEKKRKEEAVLSEFEYETHDDINTNVQKCFSVSREEIEDMLEYMCNHSGENVSLQYFANKYHFSESYLSRLFKKETGSTYITVLNALRMYKAITLFSSQHGQIQDICEETGFCDQHYFATLFKKILGCTPSKYKKQPTKIAFCDIIKLMERG